VLILLAASFLFYWVSSPGLPGLPRWISVAHGEQRTISLRDGSIIHVNASSAVKVAYSKEQRLIELDHGQALFGVANDSKRPFRVRAGSTEITAVGTQFDVYRKADRDVTVTVVQGRVRIEQGSGGRIESTRAAPTMLSAGQQWRLEARTVSTAPAQVDTRT